jgi:hypothetical protein
MNAMLEPGLMFGRNTGGEVGVIQAAFIITRIVG